MLIWKSLNMDISVVIPLDILKVICEFIPDFKGFISFITSCKRLNSINSEMKERCTESITEYPDKWEDTWLIKPRQEYRAIKGIKHGEYRKYSEQMMLVIKCSYHHGFLNGSYNSWYKHGKNCKSTVMIKHIECSYRMDKLHGTYISYHDIHCITHEPTYPRKVLNYVEGKKHGICEIRNTHNIIEPSLLIKYDSNVLVNRCNDSTRCYIYQCLKAKFKYVIFHFSPPQTPEYMWDFYFYAEGRHYLLDFDDLDSNRFVYGSDKFLANQLRIKMRLASEHNYYIIRLCTSHWSRIVTDYERFVNLAVMSGYKLFFNEESAYEKVFTTSNTDVDSNFISNDHSLIVYKPLEHLSLDDDSKWPPSGPSIDELVEPLKSLVMEHLGLSAEMDVATLIFDFVVNEFLRKKTIYRTKSRCVIHTLNDLIFNCFLYQRKFSSDDFRIVGKCEMSESLQVDMDIMMRELVAIDVNNPDDITLLDQLDNFDYHQVYNRDNTLHLERYTDIDFEENQWILSDGVLLTKKDIGIIERAVLNVLEVLDMYIVKMGERGVSCQETKDIRDEMVRSIEYAKRSSVYPK